MTWGKKMKLLICKFRDLRQDEKGATLIYLSLTMAVIFAFIGLAVDTSRFTTTATQARAAAEAAALAAARQLDGSPDSISRANAAASNFVARDQRFGETDADTISITMRYLKDLPDDDEVDIPSNMYTTDPTEALYAEATTETIAHKNFFLPVLGVVDGADLTGVAVAGQTSAVCRVTPLAICNPAESISGSGANFNYLDWKGRQILVRKGGEDSAWAPGNFGLLDSTYGQGTPDLADQLAGVDGANACFSSRLNTKPGSVNALRPALNTRFDIYENPGFQNENDNPRYPPAENVTKGGQWTAQGANQCKTYSEPPGLMGLPQDNVFTTPSGDTGGRFGNGRWDCGDYWSTNHPGVSAPAGCVNDTNSISRFEIYRYEIENNVIPGTNPPPQGTNGPEDGSPTCYEGPTIDYSAIEDRRVLYFAVMNCLEHDVRGNSENVPSEAIVKSFITEPAIGTGSDIDVFLEVVDVVNTGDKDGVLKEFVEILR